MGFFQKAVLLYLMIALAFTFAAPESVLTLNGANPAGYNIMKLFGTSIVGYNSTSHDVIISNTPTVDGNITNYTQSGTGLFSSGTGNTNQFYSVIIDPLVNMLGFIFIIFQIVLSPLILLTSPVMVGAPTAIYVLIGLPLVLLFFLATAIIIGGRVDN